MPRPSKHVSPDTLGGRIRLAREHQKLSLADIASGHYSTSLISQIERNRVDPSQESLRFLAERLQLPLSELEVLAQQHRESEVEARQYVSYDALRNESAQLLADGKAIDALRSLEPLHLSHVPVLQRWRLASLRGQCYFKKRQFIKAQKDLIYAIQEKPDEQSLSPEQRQEMVLLHLRSAETYYALEALDDALTQFNIMLRLVNHSTPFGYIAEAQWMISLIEADQANTIIQEPINEQDAQQKKLQKLRDALEHANNALHLYRSIGEQLQAASLTCHIITIEKEIGQAKDVKQRLLDLLDTWEQQWQQTPLEGVATRKAQASVVSSAAYMLATIALEQGKSEEALQFASKALEAANASHIVRQAEAHTVLGKVFSAQHNSDRAVEEFRTATMLLDKTERVGARINAYVQLGMYLYQIGKQDEGEKAFDEVRHLSESLNASSDTMRDKVTQEDFVLVS